MDDTRQETIAGLRALADFLEKNPGVPAPSLVGAYGHLSYGHTFTDVLDLAERLAPCTIADGVTISHRYVTRSFGGDVRFKVRVDAAACGETRTVTKTVTDFFVDTELLRVAAEGPVRKVHSTTSAEQAAAAQARPTSAQQIAEAAAATGEVPAA